jgi:hypothetical protein
MFQVFTNIAIPSRQDAALSPQSNRQPVQSQSVSMTTADKTARRVYSAEQLHRLRASFSAPKLREAIEEHDGEDAELVKGVSSSRHITRLLLLHLPSRLRSASGGVADKQNKQRAWRRSTLSLLPAAHMQYIIPNHDLVL